jgi:hypothetical protein
MSMYVKFYGDYQKIWLASRHVLKLYKCMYDKIKQY